MEPQSVENSLLGGLNVIFEDAVILNTNSTEKIIAGKMEKRILAKDM